KRQRASSTALRKAKGRLHTTAASATLRLKLSATHSASERNPAIAADLAPISDEREGEQTKGARDRLSRPFSDEGRSVKRPGAAGRAPRYGPPDLPACWSSRLS